MSLPKLSVPRKCVTLLESVDGPISKTALSPCGRKRARSAAIFWFQPPASPRPPLFQEGPSAVLSWPWSRACANHRGAFLFFFDEG